MPKRTVKIPTDENGHYYKTELFDGTVNIKVRIKLELQSPADTKVYGSLDIDAVDGDRENQERNYIISTGETEELGTWRIDAQKNLGVWKGRTQPKRPNDEVVFELTAKPAPFG